MSVRFPPLATLRHAIAAAALPGEGQTIIDQQVIDRALQHDRPTPSTAAPVSVVSGDGWTAGLDGGDVRRLSGEHAIVAATRGEAVHLVDFVPVPATPGAVLHIHPGQVVQISGASAFTADAVRIRADHCPSGLFPPGAPRCSVEPGPSLDVIHAIVADLVREQASAAPSEAVMVAAGRYLLQRIASSGRSSGPMSAQAELLQRFRVELERSFSVTRAVSYYAGTIGASAKTLSRATAALTGRSPKEVIDDRVTLEARRLLAHTGHPSSAIGTMLGFSEPTNFTKFFVRNTDMSPQEFRVSIG